MRTNSNFELDPAYFELQSMYLLAKLIAKKALYRTENAAPLSPDYPKPEAKWRKHIEFHSAAMECERMNPYMIKRYLLGAP